jgi:hypothetical protein
VIAAATGLSQLTPANRVLNPAGIKTWEVTVDGGQTNSGRLLVGSGTNKITLKGNGDMTVQGTISGNKLYAGIMTGAGLTDCDIAGTSKLLWDTTTGRFSCGTDQTVGTGLDYPTAHAILVDQAGDTMTGTLTVNLTSGFLGVKVVQMLSGSLIHAEKTLSASGAQSIAWEGSGTGNALWVRTHSGTTLESQTLSGGALYATKSFGGSGTWTNEGAGSGQALTVGGGTVSISKSGQTVFNVNSRGIDFTVKGASDGVLFVVDASQDRIGIGTAAPKTKLNVQGTVSGATIQANVLSGYLLRYDQRSPVKMQVELFSSGSTITTGSGKMMLTIADATMSGYVLKGAHLSVQTAGTTNTTSVQIRNASKGNRKMFSTVISIDSAENGSDTAATPYVITNADVGAYDRLIFDVPAVSTTAPRGSLQLYLEFFKP